MKSTAKKFMSMLLAMAMLAGLFAVHPLAVKAEDDTPVLLDLFANFTDVKQSYTVGETLDLTGLKVIAFYSDDTSKQVYDYVANPAHGSVIE
ncbi:MAG: bacterial Ig-like domain-containing protein, partial [Defluviitaleaceae bacterium]|nr:bacterial Ig-like domain-containing protein [Defluviitaleaceae bacterium]